jgi:hypothetical protein
MDQSDIQRFRQLLENEETRRKNRKSFFHKNQDEYLELLSYRTIIRDQYFYQNRSKYLLIIKDFLEKKINTGTFSFRFNSLVSEDIHSKYYNLIQENLEELSTFLIDFKSKGFYYLIDQMDKICDEIDPYRTEPGTYDEDDEINDLSDEDMQNYEEEIQKDIQQLYDAIKNYGETP